MPLKKIHVTAIIFEEPNKIVYAIIMNMLFKNTNDLPQEKPKKGGSVNHRIIHAVRNITAAICLSTVLPACDPPPATENVPSMGDTRPEPLQAEITPSPEVPHVEHHPDNSIDHFDVLIMNNLQSLLGKRYGYIMKNGTFTDHFDLKKEKSYTCAPKDCIKTNDMRVNCISYLQYVYSLNDNPVLGKAWACICDRDNYPKGIPYGKTTLSESWLKKHKDIIYGAMFDWVYSGKPYELGLIDNNGHIFDKKKFLTEAIKYLEWYEKYMKEPLPSDDMEILNHNYELPASESKLVTMKFPQNKIKEAVSFIRDNFIPHTGMTCHITYLNRHTGTVVNENGNAVFYNAGAIGTAKGEKTTVKDWFFGAEELEKDLESKTTELITLTVSTAHTINKNHSQPKKK